MDVIKYLERLVKSLGMDVDENGAIHTLDKPLKIGGLPVYIPTQYAKTNLTKNVNGKAVQQLRLFNPFVDDLGGHNKYAEALIKIFGVITRVNISVLIKAHIVANVNKDIRFPLNDKFFMVLANYNKSKVKKSVFDEKCMYISEFVDTHISDKKYLPVKFHVRNNHKYKGETYRSILLGEYPLYEASVDGELPSKFRKKDIGILRSIYEALLPIDELVAFSLGKTHNKLTLLLKAKSKFDEAYRNYIDQALECEDYCEEARLLLKGIIYDEDDSLLEDLGEAFEASGYLPTDQTSDPYETMTNGLAKEAPRVIDNGIVEQPQSSGTKYKVETPVEEEEEIIYDLAGNPVRKVKKRVVESEPVTPQPSIQQPAVQQPAVPTLDINQLLTPQNPMASLMGNNLGTGLNPLNMGTGLNNGLTTNTLNPLNLGGFNTVQPALNNDVLMKTKMWLLQNGINPNSVTNEQLMQYCQMYLQTVQKPKLNIGW